MENEDFVNEGSDYSDENSEDEEGRWSRVTWGTGLIEEKIVASRFHSWAFGEDTEVSLTDTGNAGAIEGSGR